MPLSSNSVLELFRNRVARQGQFCQLSRGVAQLNMSHYLAYYTLNYCILPSTAHCLPTSKSLDKPGRSVRRSLTTYLLGYQRGLPVTALRGFPYNSAKNCEIGLAK
jgi:hypothetical protein